MTVDVADPSLAPSPSRTERPDSLPRLLGVHDTGHDGPTVIVTTAIHGNEPSGIDAARAVLAELDALGMPFRGRFVCLVGNRQATSLGQRYLHTDLNRIWTEAEVGALATRPSQDDSPEQAEMRELVDALDTEIARARGPVVLVDLHSTSARGAPFVVLGDTLANRALAEALPIPAVAGLNERVEGALVLWMTRRGVPAIVVEGGCRLDASTMDHHRATLWLVLERAGAVGAGDVPDIAGYFARLKDAARGSCGFAVVRSVKSIQPGDRFVMKPGYENFQRVQRGEILANDKSGPIRAPWDAILLMPLYQPEGEDGFFLAREVPRSWLVFSTRARQSRLDRLLPSLPGVRAHPRRVRAVCVDAETITLLIRKLLTVFGYERKGFEEDSRVYVRLPEPGEM